MKLKDYLNTLSYAQKILIKHCISPIYLILFVTEQCNARCKHCFGSFTSNHLKAKEDLALDEIDKISSSMGNLLYLLPTGGEPFLREDLPEIINIFYRNNRLRNVGIPTNGSLPDKVTASINRILSLCEDLFLGVDISIDGLQETHDSIRGFPGLFERAIDTYWRLKEIEGKNKKFKVCVEVTVSKFNQEHLYEIYEYFIKTLKSYNIFVRLVRGNPRDPSAREVDIKKFEKFSQMMEQDLKSGVLYGHAVYPLSTFITARDIIGRRLTIKIVKEGKYQIPCYAGNLTGVLRSNGDVYPCELLDHRIGNLRECDYNFKYLWQSETAQAIRKVIRENKCFCTHECFITNNILFNVKMLPRIIKECIDLKLTRGTNTKP